MKTESQSKSGLIYVFTGPGKGKTSAALGVAIRAFAAGMSVGWVAWYKQSSWGISEFSLPKILDSNRWQMHALGAGFHIDTPSKVTKSGTKNIKVAKIASNASVIDTASENEHEQAAAMALAKALEIIDTVDVLVLDEVNNALADGLVSLSAIQDVLEGRGATHLILTGRDAHPDIIKAADLVTSMDKVKHPYDAGKLAVKGLDF